MCHSDMVYFGKATMFGEASIPRSDKTRCTISLQYLHKRIDDFTMG